MRSSQGRYMACLSTLIVQCGAPAPGPFGPAIPPTTWEYTLVSSGSGITVWGTASVAEYTDGRLLAGGMIRGGPAGTSYVLHLHRGGCGAPAAAFDSGPAVSALPLSLGPAETTFRPVPVTRDVLDGSWMADVHQVGSAAVLACAPLR